MTAIQVLQRLFFQMCTPDSVEVDGDPLYPDTVTISTDVPTGGYGMRCIRGCSVIEVGDDALWAKTSDGALVHLSYSNG